MLQQYKIAFTGCAALLLITACTTPDSQSAPLNNRSAAAFTCSPSSFKLVKTDARVTSESSDRAPLSDYRVTGTFLVTTSGWSYDVTPLPYKTANYTVYEVSLKQPAGMALQVMSDMAFDYSFTAVPDLKAIDLIVKDAPHSVDFQTVKCVNQS